MAPGDGPPEPPVHPEADRQPLRARRGGAPRRPACWRGARCGSTIRCTGPGSSAGSGARRSPRCRRQLHPGPRRDPGRDRRIGFGQDLPGPGAAGPDPGLGGDLGGGRALGGPGRPGPARPAPADPGGVPGSLLVPVAAPDRRADRRRGPEDPRARPDRRNSAGPACWRPWTDVGLAEDGSADALLGRYPHEFSGGQRQRIAIARALIVKPRIVVLDEPTSSLDVTIQKQVLQLLAQLQRRHGLSYVLVTHDIDVVRAMAHRVLVMKDGRVVREGPRGPGAVGRPVGEDLASAVPPVVPDGRLRVPCGCADPPVRESLAACSSASPPARAPRSHAVLPRLGLGFLRLAAGGRGGRSLECPGSRYGCCEICSM